MIKKIALLVLIALALGSCASRKDIVYFQNISSVLPSEQTKYEPKLKPDDLLVIIVFSPVPEATLRFNLSTTFAAASSFVKDVAPPQRDEYLTYLIDNQGNVQFPIIGDIKLGGLTKAEAVKKMNSELEKYITEPSVSIRIVNYKISVMGEVIRPGSINVVTERVTLPDAISMAGDMTIYGKRDNVLVIREVNGQKSFTYVDMTKADFINSDFYYLSQNDIVVVEPNKTRINSSIIGPNIAIIFSSVSLLITIIALVTK